MTQGGQYPQTEGRGGIPPPPRQESEGVGNDKVLVIGDIKLTKNEKSALLLNPKYGIFGEINEEEVQKELEIGGVKTRWDMMSNVEHYEETAELLEAPEEESATSSEARVRQIFDHESNSIKFSNKRATDYKQNASIYLPKAVNIEKQTYQEKQEKA